MAFGVIVFCAVTFIILPLFGQINALVGKIPDYTTKMDAATFDWLLEDPANYPRLPHNIESLFDYITLYYQLADGFCGSGFAQPVKIDA